MEAGTLEKKIELLNFNEKLKIEGYVDALLDEKGENLFTSPIEIKSGFGGGKGLIAYMADDFDAPLKEFHEYMYRISIDLIDKIENLPSDKQLELEEIVNKMTEATNEHHISY